MSVDPSHSVYLACLWVAPGPICLYFLTLLCPASPACQDQGTNVMLAPSEIFIPQKTGLCALFHVCREL